MAKSSLVDPATMPGAPPDSPRPDGKGIIAGLIIAKGYSRRLERKNLRLVCGKPLVAWSVIQLVNSIHMDRVWVSTDDTEIADVAREYGAEVLWRLRPEAQNPKAAANWVYIDMLEQIAAMGIQVDRAHMALPTCPLRLPWDFDRCMELLIQLGASQVIPLCPELETEVYEVDVHLARPVWADKSGRYATQGGGWSTWEVPTYMPWNRYLQKVYDDPNLTDEKIDRKFFTGPYDMSLVWAPPRGHYYYRLQPWQQWDIDDEGTLELCEIAMRRNIIDKLGSDCYERYASGNA